LPKCFKEFAAKEKLEIVKERGEPASGRAAKLRGLVFAAAGGEKCSNYFKYTEQMNLVNPTRSCPYFPNK